MYTQRGGNMIVAQQLRTVNDVNGNPRRVWTYQLIESGFSRMVACIDEGYGGRPHKNGHMRKGQFKRHAVIELASVEIQPAEYHEHKRWGERLHREAAA